MQIYPAIDIKNGQCVRLRQGKFDDVTVYGDDPIKVAEKFVKSGAQARDVGVFIIDIRSNGGGSGGTSIGKWYQSFTKQQLNEKIVWATRHSVLKGDTSSKSNYTLDQNRSGSLFKNNIPIILLVDDNCGSNGEDLLCAAKKK